MSTTHHGIEVLSQFAMEAILKAGKQALSFYGKGKPEMKFDEGLIIETELKVTEFFQDQLDKNFPEHQLFNNDSVSDVYTHDGKRYLWIFDPLDGVSNIQAGIPIWATSLALLENFWSVIGMIFLPATGDVFHALAGKKALWNNKEIQITTHETVNNESLLLTYSRFHQHYRTTFPGKIRNLGCTAAHICYVAMGRADAVIIAHESFQGLAAARVIIEAAGGKIYKLNGEEFFLNEYLEEDQIDEHLLVTSPVLCSQVIEEIDRIY